MTSPATSLEFSDGSAAGQDSPFLVPPLVSIPVSAPRPGQPSFPPEYYLG